MMINDLYKLLIGCGFDSGKSRSMPMVNPMTAPPPGLVAADTVPP
jgi:hypothetical protein